MASFAMAQGVTVEEMAKAMGAPVAEPKPAAVPQRRKTEAPAKS